ncbi:hypothetical protein KKC97_08710, partial [bacterium]|nr:hypothetical protein [bacterium]
MSESNLDLIAKRKPESIGFLNFGASVYLLASVIAGIYFFVATGYSDLMTWYMRWVGVGVLA